MFRYGGMSSVPGAPGNLMAGSPSFDINRTPGALGGRSGEQLKRLYEGGTQQNQQLNDELKRRGIMPGGPRLPLAFRVVVNSSVPRRVVGRDFRVFGHGGSIALVRRNLSALEVRPIET